MSNNKLVCECGHEIHDGRCYYWECKPGHEDCYNCPCGEFTDTRLAVLRAENERLERSLKASNINLSHCSQVALEQQARGDHWELKCKGLQAEIARLTPTETNVPPTKPGWYWRVNDEIDEWETVHVRQDLDGNLYTESRDDDGTVVINLQLHGTRWSAEPITMPIIEKEGEI